MPEQKFEDPSIHLNRIYTRAGDAGQTRLVGGQRVEKDDARLETYGTVDELNAFVGVARVTAELIQAQTEKLKDLPETLKRVQHELFNLGSLLATLPEDLQARQPTVTQGDIDQLEREIDAANTVLQPLGSFVLPGGSRLEAELHVCRTVCRRAERLLVCLSRVTEVPAVAIGYLNRLSDAFFVWSRWANQMTQHEETLWRPNAAAGASHSA